MTDAASTAEALARLRARLGAGRGPRAVVVPAPALDAERLLDAWPGAHAVLFQGRDGLELAGWGAHAALDARGPGRFEALADATRRALGALAVDADPDVPAELATPRAVGGLAFAPGAADAEPWRGFGDAAFVVPRLAYARRGARAALTVVVDGTEQDGAAVDRAAALLAAFARAPAPPGPPAAVEAVAHLAPSRWRARIDAILAAIARGEVEKVVAARRSTLDAAAPIAVADVLARLRQTYGTCARFAFVLPDGAAFVGATPERLLALDGLRLDTEALAGTRAADPEAEALLESAKDVAEHAPVVRLILERLRPHARELRPAGEPELRRLRNVVHIRTAITGELTAPVPLLRLAGALHPTPAVGGAPEPAASDWIAAHEEAARGWYAGPFGWVDAAGGGELVVALRSALVRGARAHLWAGGGIVAGSTADAEYEETALKLRPMMEAIGALEPAPPSGPDGWPERRRFRAEEATHAAAEPRANGAE